MELTILITEWTVRVKEDKSKTIAGKYAVMCGPNKVAASNFNDGYDSTDIQIPANLLTDAEALDAKIRQTIAENFTGKEEKSK